MTEADSRGRRFTDHQVPSHIGGSLVLTNQVGEEEVMHLLSDEGHGKQAADHQGKVLWRITGAE